MVERFKIERPNTYEKLGSVADHILVESSFGFMKLRAKWAKLDEDRKKKMIIDIFNKIEPAHYQNGKSTKSVINILKKS